MFDQPLKITETNDQIARVFIASILDGVEISEKQSAQLGEYLALIGESKTRTIMGNS